MPLSQWNLEWLNHNAARRYPLSEDATAVDVTGSFTIPTDLLVELDLPVHAAIDAAPDQFFIRLLGAYPTGYSLTVACNTPNGYVDVATAMIPRVQYKRNMTFALGGVEPFDDTMGKLVIGRLDTADEQPSGLWEFAPEATPLEPDCIRPSLRGVQALVIVDNGQRSQPLYGDIELLAGTNMRITPLVSNGRNIIRFDAVSGEGLSETCVCEGDSTAKPCIQTINGVGPTPDGKLYLLGDKCIQVNPVSNGLQITDKCCQPCCSCTDLEAITRDLDRFNVERATLKLFLDQLMASNTQMELTVLGSRLGDKGCITCQ